MASEWPRRGFLAQDFRLLFGYEPMSATQTSQTTPFVDYLKAHLKLNDGELPEPGEWSDAGNTIGMLALRMNLLMVDQIDHVLELQEKEGNIRRFGEVAESVGLLSHRQVSRLLAIQSLNREMELGERLVLAGRIDVHELVRHLNDFVNGRSENRK